MRERNGWKIGGQKEAEAKVAEWKNSVKNVLVFITLPKCFLCTMQSSLISSFLFAISLVFREIDHQFFDDYTKGVILTWKTPSTFFVKLGFLSILERENDQRCPQSGEENTFFSCSHPISHTQKFFISRSNLLKLFLFRKNKHRTHQSYFFLHLLAFIAQGWQIALKKNRSLADFLGGAKNFLNFFFSALVKSLSNSGGVSNAMESIFFHFFSSVEPEKMDVGRWNVC